MSSVDELAHQLKHIASQEHDGRKPFAYGHIATYDANTGAVKVVYPSLRNEDGTPTMSPWIPLSTGWAGPSGQSFGVQYHPIGGASLENPTAGEQVVVNIIDTQYGSALGASLCFNQSAKPPRSDLLPGEWCIQGPKGSFILFHADGRIELVTASDTNLDITASDTVNIKGTNVVNVTAPQVNIQGAIGDTLQPLATKALKDWAATHTHPGTAAPSTPPPTDAVTTVLFGE